MNHDLYENQQRGPGFFMIHVRGRKHWGKALEDDNAPIVNDLGEKSGMVHLEKRFVGFLRIPREP